MCGRFTVLERCELEGCVRAIEYATPFNLQPDWPAAAKDVFPGARVDIVRSVESSEGTSRAQIASLMWGFPLSGQGSKVAYNARSESATTSPFWQESFANRRCIVPARAFFEPHRTETALRPAIAGTPARKVRQAYRFTDADGLALLMAGVWAEGRFSVLTTPPNPTVSAVHDRMPLLLTFDQALLWLHDRDFATEIVARSHIDAGGGAAIGSDGTIALEASGEVVLKAKALYPPMPEDPQLTLF